MAEIFEMSDDDFMRQGETLLSTSAPEEEQLDDATQEEETLTDIDLKFLKKKNKKVKNVIENALLVKREELNELFDILLDEKIVRQNLKEEFIEILTTKKEIIEEEIKELMK